MVLLGPIKAPVVLGAECRHDNSRGQRLTFRSRIQTCPSPLPKMPRPFQPLSLLVLLVLAATAQGQAGTGPKVLQPWLLGLTAVVVFLFIVFLMLLINRFWNLRRRRKENDYPETLESDRLGRSGHVNPAAEDCDELSDDKQESKATSF